MKLVWKEQLGESFQNGSDGKKELVIDSMWKAESEKEGHMHRIHSIENKFRLECDLALMPTGSDKYDRVYKSLDDAKESCQKVEDRVVKEMLDTTTQGYQEEKIAFETGATRSARFAGGVGKPARFDLITPIGLRRLAETYAEGAALHGVRNWEKGMPIEDCISRAMAHISVYNGGDRTEDHLAHAAWNLFAAMHFQEKPVDAKPNDEGSPNSKLVRFDLS